MKKIVLILVVLVVVGGGLYYTMSYVTNKNAQNSLYVPAVSNKEGIVPLTSPSPDVVGISNFAFNPSTITVKAGTKITWENNDSVPHTVTSDTDNILNSPIINPGESFEFTFVNVGRTDYHCTIHPMMKGIVIVEAQ